MANDVWSFSTGSNRIQIQGNAKIIREIRNLADNAISKKISLYDVQENIKKYLCEKYGNVWYEKVVRPCNTLSKMHTPVL